MTIRATCIHPLLSILAVSLLGLPAIADPDPAVSSEYRDVHVFFQTLEKIQDYYVDEMSTEELLRLAIDGIVEGLDLHTRFMEPEAFETLRAKTQGRFHGVGVVVALRGDYPTIISPIDDTPAKRAGVMAGDRIVAIDDESAEGMSLEDVVIRLRGAEGSAVQLHLGRDGVDDPVPYRLVREEIRVDSVVGPLTPEEGVGYIRVRRFSEETSSEFSRAVAALSPDVKGLVLDLRGNPGGLLSQAVELADHFVPAGEVIVEVRSRNRADCRTYRASSGRKWTKPIAVLVDEGSASAAEIVAGALQDHERGLVVGQPTFGKGSVQSIFAFEAGHALKLTTAHYYTPSGRSVERLPLSEAIQTAEGLDENVAFTGGIRPDLIVEEDIVDSLAIDLMARGHITAFISKTDAPPAPADLSQPLQADYIAAFEAFVAERGDTSFESVQDVAVDRALREELALRAGGTAAAIRVRLAWDRLFRHAVDALRRESSEVAAAVSGSHP